MQRFFDDGPPPYPSIRSLRECVGYVRAFGEGPPWHPLRAERGCEGVARQIVEQDLGPKARAVLLHERWTGHLDRELSSFERFAEEVDLAVRALLRDRPAFDGERTPRPGSSDVKLPLDRARDLRPRFEAVQRFAQQKLPEHLREWLNDGIDLAWSRHPSKSHLAYWGISTTGRNRGQRRIRVNCVYRTKSSIVSDEMLEYLLWHELLHDVLPGRGHDAEFRELEARFENAVELDAEWDTLGERYDLDPERYAAHAM